MRHTGRRVAQRRVAVADPDTGPTITVTATDAKNRFGPLLDRALEGRAVVITKHDSPKAILLSIEQYRSLVNAGEPSLHALTGEFDAMLARMQTPASKKGLEKAFAATGVELGKLAAAHAKRRG